MVTLIAVGVAGAMFAAYYAHPDDLWRGVYHDRNAHLTVGMNFALAIKAADPARFFSQLLAMKVWGPLHGLALAAVFLAGGVDHRLAIIPSLLGWIATVVLSWLIARRLFADRIQGMFAGVLALVWIVASPALRLLCSDVMLEGLGAGLTALALWAYLAARADPGSSAKWRALAIVLTLLFFHKANYWGLTTASLALAALSETTALWRGWRDKAVAEIRPGRWSPRALADPWLIVFAALAALIAWLYWRGPGEMSVFGRRLSLYPPENLVTVAYGVLFVRGWLFWRKHRDMLRRRMGVAGRNLFYWHAAPIAVSFLLPRRLASFLWYVGPADNSLPGSPYDPVAGVVFYWRNFADGFSVSAWTAVLALALAAVGLSQIRRYPAGGRAVFSLALLSALAVVAHPQHQGRFLASWIFAVWICAGAGGAVILGRLIAERARWPRAVAAGLLAAALAGASAAQKPSPSAYETAIRAASGPSDLALVRPFLPSLAGARVVGFAATFGPSDLFTWTAEEHCQCQLVVEHPWISADGSPADVERQMLGQVARSKAERWVVIDAPGWPDRLETLGYEYDHLVGVVDAMKAQTRYAPVAAYPIPEEGAVATVYKAAGA